MRKFPKHPSDGDLIAGIRTGGSQRRHFENKLYEKYAYLIRSGTHKHRLSEDDTASAYSDTVLSVIEHVTIGRFEGRSELKTYIYQIFTNKCVDLIRKKTTNRSSVHDALSLDDSFTQLPDEARSALQRLIAQGSVERLQRHLKDLGDKCYTMLMAWGEGYSDEEIAQQIGYNTAAVAKTSRLRCLERLRAVWTQGVE
ncbi:RNA polymerase, sigma-24 subunit, ECF subfamily [Fibrisoma limi BUZ 3]|uniref:RNA polymerase, sigma-24 subunit, ECF subfamily n=1 Tax=Fibrisoma limi BUZ 3 TaxID=1185876 RepID=I2GKC8_9BACT|nr:sigma-70 family RNA polymerase sigma factor [Fibrisoma limi]CCH54353.1 RNA polymerase, sigma-24 subunit, ECF subfamily [Fibrisoma limi BUZ 3]